MEFKVIVCDDNQILADSLSKKINYLWQSIKDDNPKFKRDEIKILNFCSYEEVIEELKESSSENGIFFLDIELKNKNGVDLAAAIKQYDPKAQIVFVTAYDKYAPLTYRRRIGAVDYINKNENEEEINRRIIATLRDALENIEYAESKKADYFEYKVGSRLFKILKQDIYYIENSPFIRSNVNLVFKNGMSEFRGNIKQLESQNEFLTKVSQSVLVNMSNVIEIDLKNRWLVFPGNIKVAFARRKKKEIQKIIESN